ncbi:hypothetical protein PR202_gb13553 [Eleusine coracana subsp. coracana]|uniref:Uncharacterized protein n=1 Tax=Eleusine coracana subsp. coracana TaxID=191504 RepID=A0AAV5ESW7_ELECO|nr:hypothetical protein PR202_gb13553 [Eleusine coracana subsp. coracana]
MMRPIVHERHFDLLLSCAKDNTPTVCFRFDAPARSVEFAVGDALVAVIASNFMNHAHRPGQICRRERFFLPTMSSGEGALKRCTAGSVEGIGEGGMMVSCPAKRKVEEVPSCGKVLDPMSECTTRMKVEEASSCAVAVAVAKAESAAGSTANKTRKPNNRMSTRDIRWILAHKPSAGPSHYQALKESNPDLTPSPEEEMDESRAEAQAAVEEAWKEIETMLLSETEDDDTDDEEDDANDGF